MTKKKTLALGVTDDEYSRILEILYANRRRDVTKDYSVSSVLRDLVLAGLKQFEGKVKNDQD